MFEGKNHEDLLRQNKECDLSNIPMFISHISKEARDLLSKLLKKDPTTRPSAKEALNHKWFLTDREALMDGLFINSYFYEIELKRQNLIKDEHILKIPCLKH